MANLLDEASILLTPTAYNNGSMLAVKPTNGDGDFTFSRNSAATRVNAQGLIEDVAINLPRIDYTDGCGSLLLEPQSTNLVYNSNDGFASSSMNLVYNSAISPDGTQNAYKSTTTGATGAYVRTLNVAFANTSAFSMFLKYGNNQWYQIINAAKTGNFVNVDIQNGVFGTNGADTENLSIKDFGNGWYRVSGTFINALSTATLRVYAGSSSSSNWAATSAPIGSYNYGFGFQVEAQSYATSYIPTQGASSTRLQDIATNSGNASLINSEEGVLYVEIAGLADLVSSRLSINDGTNLNTIQLAQSPTVSNNYTFRNSSGTFVKDFTVSDITDYHKIAIKYELNNYSVWIDGVEVATDTLASVFPIGTLENISFDRGDGSFKTNSKIRTLAVYKTALTDARLTELTTI